MQLFSTGVIVSEKFCFSKCVCLLLTSLSYMENNLLPNRQGYSNRLKHVQFSQGVPVLWMTRTNKYTLPAVATNLGHTSVQTL